MLSSMSTPLAVCEHSSLSSLTSADPVHHVQLFADVAESSVNMVLLWYFILNTLNMK